ncbi:hypothetical protein HC931_02430 [Candidatus Gracilibacteria bacterium]|jgi:hypothetical protein|nr:hypothetical protein [Candidatus Gracilibacteria bacterium]NJM86636.1 hypothetical protein [Hydrococcus sp. RU_2_2]NJP21525.1 hypothetical protein [Hydrococcus sp. CRU_1_1]
MKTANFLTSSCRYCRYYNPEGRRGGMCQQLGVPVQSGWKACVLAARPFNSAWEKLEEVVHLENSLALEQLSECHSVDTPCNIALTESKQRTAV